MLILVLTEQLWLEDQCPRAVAGGLPVTLCRGGAASGRVWES